MSRFRLLSSMVVMAVMATLVLAPTAHATFPGRNGLIAFTADTGSGTQIYTVRPNGHGLRQITHVDGDAIKPDWSPDGRRIAFALNECSIAIMNADGSNLTVLPSQTPGGCEADPSFTPDGSRLVFERYDPSIEDDAVWSMNLDGTDRQPITSAGAPIPTSLLTGRPSASSAAQRMRRRSSPPLSTEATSSRSPRSSASRSSTTGRPTADTSPSPTTPTTSQGPQTSPPSALTGPACAT